MIETVIRSAYQEYLELYLNLVDEAKPVSDARAASLLAGQHRYTTYRAEKDPARGMLTRFYGADWTEAYIVRNEETAPVFEGTYKDLGYEYPHSMLHDEHLYVVYSVNKEDIEVLRFSLDQLSQP